MVTFIRKGLIVQEGYTNRPLHKKRQKHNLKAQGNFKKIKHQKKQANSNTKLPLLLKHLPLHSLIGAYGKRMHEGFLQDLPPHPAKPKVVCNWRRPIWWHNLNHPPAKFLKDYGKGLSSIPSLKARSYALLIEQKPASPEKDSTREHKQSQILPLIPAFPGIAWHFHQSLAWNIPIEEAINFDYSNATKNLTWQPLSSLTR